MHSNPQRAARLIVELSWMRRRHGLTVGKHAEESLTGSASRRRFP